MYFVVLLIIIGKGQPKSEDSSLGNGIFFNHQIVDNELLTLHGVFTHIVFKHLMYGILLAEHHGIQPHVGTNEVFELFGRYLAETFESGNLSRAATLLDSCQSLLFGIAVTSNFLVTYAE